MQYHGRKNDPYQTQKTLDNVNPHYMQADYVVIIDSYMAYFKNNL